MAEEARPLRDPLADLRERLEATREAAEQLAGEAASAARAEREGEDPGPGWRTAEEREALRDDARVAGVHARDARRADPAGAARAARRGPAPGAAARARADRLDRRAPAADPRRRAGRRGHPGSARPRRRAYTQTMAAERPTTWILTGSPENFETTREHGFSVIGMKERRRYQALQMEPGDRIVFYLTKIGKFGGSVRITSEMFEDREPLWPGQAGQPRPLPVALPHRAGADPRRRGPAVRPRTSRTTSSTSASGRPTTGSSPSRASCERCPTRTPTLLLERMRAAAGARA